MLGLPMQTAASARETLQYCRQLFDRFSTYPNHFDITFALLAPFVDPGSPAFCYPQAHGYRIFSQTLADHRAAMRQLHWKDVLGYETEAMEKAELADMTVEVSEKLCDLRRQFGSLKPKHAQEYLRELDKNRVDS
jgi:hypothetical protein